MAFSEYMNFNREENEAATKEVCNRGHGLSAAIKLCRKSGEKCWSFSYCTLACTEQSYFCRKSYTFLIRCQTKVLLWWLQVSLKPDCENWGSGVPILMAADKPCPQLQPSLVCWPVRCGASYSSDDAYIKLRRAWGCTLCVIIRCQMFTELRSQL